MRKEDIMSRPAKVLSQAQREEYFEDGAVVVPALIGAEWLGKLRDAIDRQIELSRAHTKSGAIFDLEPTHTAEEPRLRRVSSPCDQDEVFWQFLTDSKIGDAFEDLLGPNVKFYQSKLNFKWAKGGAEVKWHQDAPFFPHTNTSVLTCGLYLNDCDMDQGPLAILPGSHKGPIYDHYTEDGHWTGDIQDKDLGKLDVDNVRYLHGPAGSVTFHNYRTVHGSKPNLTGRGRPLLLNVVSSADSLPYTSQPLPSRYEQAIIRGQQARWAHHDDGDYIVPPDWSGGYTSIFATQQREQM
ncbi:MAG: phytanoyl-CoA dioxygenase [Rhodospirillaceae bacterium]|nr:phytanoyl-CoA dioxygenase [Rhodospirillaceae bacterium]